MGIKVVELAKKLNVLVAEVMEQLQRLYVDLDEGEDTEIDEKIGGLIRLKLGRVEPKEKKLKKIKTKKKETEAKKKKTEKKSKPKKPTKIKEEKSEKKEKPKKDKDKKNKKVKKAKEDPEKEVKKKKTKATTKTDVEKEEIKEAETSKEEKKAAKKKSAFRPIQITRRARVKEKSRAPETKTVAQEEQKKKVSTYEESGAKQEKLPEKMKSKPVNLPKKETVDPDALIKEGDKPHKGMKKRIRIKRVKAKSQSKGYSGKFAKGLVGGSNQAVGERKIPQKVKLNIPINIRTLAPHINVKPGDIIKYAMGTGLFVNINQDLDEDTARDIMSNFGYELELRKTTESIEREMVSELHDGEKTAVEVRAPVVTFMGHVDHGKTSLLDFIRKTMVTKGEKGGITQHIGAYKVDTPGGSVTFLDTPGHAAFTAMRARGAHATDVVVLVVAADDGVMPQTKEAIDHARAANVPIVVAINKCDLVNANPDKVKKELQQEGLITEDWGGKTIMVPVSAITGEGIDTLMELLMLESELLELKANSRLRARGVVIESKKTPGQGVVATLLVQNGTLHPWDIVLCGEYYGKIKAMINDQGERVETAPPATPVEVLGLQGVPEAGDEFFVVKDEKKAKILTGLKQSEKRLSKMTGSQRVTLEEFHSLISEGTLKELKVVLKADVQGSIEALKQSLEELSTDEVKLNIIHSAVGNINESDVMLAMVSNAIIMGFHVKVDTQADDIRRSEKIDIHLYDVIYEAIAEVQAGMEGLLEPEEREVFQGRAQVLEIFSASKIGKVAGCNVIKGTIHRKDKVRVKRGDEIIFTGNIDALKRFKDDVKDVREGFECGISLRGFTEVRKNDIIESFIIEKIARRLEKNNK